MTYDMYRMIFIGGLIMTGIMLVVTVLLFFVLRIPQVIGDLTGANARKGIETIRSQTTNARSSDGYKPRKTTSTAHNTGKIASRRLSEDSGLRNTERIAGKKASSPPAEETTVLTPPANETTVLNAVGNETTVLTPEVTSVPAPAPTPAPPVQQASPALFVIERELTFIHTDEIIA